DRSVGAERERPDDRGVRDTLERAGLALEASGGAIAVRAHDLHRHLAILREIAGGEHGAHAALAEQLAELVATRDEIPGLRLAHVLAEPPQCSVVDHRSGSTPSTARASLRNSSSLAVSSRNVSRTRARISRRVQAR